MKAFKSRVSFNSVIRGDNERRAGDDVSTMKLESVSPEPRESTSIRGARDVKDESEFTLRVSFVNQSEAD